MSRIVWAVVSLALSLSLTRAGLFPGSSQLDHGCSRSRLTYEGSKPAGCGAKLRLARWTLFFVDFFLLALRACCITVLFVFVGRRCAVFKMHGTRLGFFVLALGIRVVMFVVSMLDPDSSTGICRVDIIPALLMRRDGLRVRPWWPERPPDPALGEGAQD
ncbi:hypothetical protein L226DRAFT_23446 [Lentinus tigrinus ALCF2SS1-7]|uniref:uncharacterized protein n=1 Tax=Lentinus tigrinus ALCF2SS1-7 TaxID=1328758 RepID=UPI00116614D9|nr:hypothetical protein L226DRAFT_23446 [Lentinus tigrinus ALCF2SS1-7]